MSRALVLAGGGMRVAWQAGVLRALEEEQIAFDHVDGTSGGILSAGMVLSGQSASEMCRRWGELDVQDFASALPLRDYVGGPWSLPALGDADGLLHKVFPHLGIDVAAIRSSARSGTFNVVDFTEKRCLALDAADVDAELLAAGMSLPLFMPPLQRDGHVYTDAVWVRDANVGEALRRGCREIWLIWCIGNTARWGEGPLEQYVHMIEMSAMGALLADFDAARAAGTDFVLHVVRPDHPLPLDPELYLGRIGADDLVAMGYADARRYLGSRTAAGVPPDFRCTRMTEPDPGVRFTERLHGHVRDEAVTAHVVTVLPLDAGEPARAAVSTGSPPRVLATVSGYLDHEPWGGRVYFADGCLQVDGDQVSYRARVLLAGVWRGVEIRRVFTDDRGLDAWADATTAELVVGDLLSTTLHLGVGGMARLLASVEPVGAHGFSDRADAVRHVARRGLRAALSSYLHSAPA